MDVTEVVVALIGLCGTIITTFVVPYLKKNMDVKTQEKIMLYTDVAVQAAESIYQSGHGQEKKQYVLDYLADKGIAVDDEQIEAAVYGLINKDKIKSTIKVSQK